MQGQPGQQSRQSRRPRTIVNRLKSYLRRALAFLGLWRSLSDAERVERAGRYIVYEGNKFDLKHPRCSVQIGSALVRGTYEAREIALIRQYVKPTDRVLELGSCMGATSLVLYDLVGRNNLLVVEADERNLELGRHSFQLNDKDVRSEFAFLVAGSPVPETVIFFSNENPSSSSVFERSATEFSASVPAKSFEETLEKEKSTVLVLDIEGGEYHLFTRAESLHSVRTILMEAHPWVIGPERMEELLGALYAHGFEIARNDGNGRFLVFERSTSERRTS